MEELRSQGIIDIDADGNIVPSQPASEAFSQKKDSETELVQSRTPLIPTRAQRKALESQ